MRPACVPRTCLRSDVRPCGHWTHAGVGRHPEQHGA